MYDPHTGRWTTQDPMAWKYLGLSPYNYCGNNPVNLVDKTGTIITVFGDESFSRKFYEYRHFLEINGFGDYFKDLDSSIEIYTIKEGWLVDDNYFNLKIKTIKWDPNHIYISSNNIALSPAITLIHEIGHAYHYEQYRNKRDISTFLEHIRQFSNGYGSIEEEKVINYIEIPAAMILMEINHHQVTRRNHDKGKTAYDISNLSPIEASSFAREWNDLSLPRITHPNFNIKIASPRL